MRYMERSTFYAPPHTAIGSLRRHMANIQFVREMSPEAPKKYSWGFAPRMTTRDNYDRDMVYIQAEIIEELIQPIKKGEHNDYIVD